MPTTQTRSSRRPTRRPNTKADGMDGVKLAASKCIGGIIEDEQLTQTEAAYLMQDAPSQVSLVTNGNLRGFSTERVLRMLARLGRDIDIVAKKSRGKQGRIRFIET